MFLRKYYSPLGEFAGAKPEDFTIVTGQDQNTNPPTPEQPETVPASEATGNPEQQPAPGTPEAGAVPQPTPGQDNPPPITAPPIEYQTSQAAVPPSSWKDQLKAEGFDDFDIKLLEHRKQTGDYKAYMEAHSVNYKDMPAAEVMRRDLRERYPNMSAENFERYFHKQVTERYNISDLAEPEDQALGKELLEQDAHSIRQKFLERQAEFTLPDKDLQAERQRLEEANMKAQQDYANQLISNPVTQSIYRDKRIVLDAGDGVQFNYEVTDPKELTDLLLNPAKYQEIVSTRDAQGNVMPDFQKTMLLAAVAKDPQKIFKALINHGKSLGRKQIQDELEHPSIPGGTPAVAEDMPLGQAFIQNGRRVNW